MTVATLPDWSEPLFKPYRHKALHGGRGSAKSHTVASALVIQAAMRPLRILCCREIQKSIRDSVKRLLDDKIAVHGLGTFYDSIDTEIRGQNGSLFTFAGLRSNPDSVKSAEGYDIAWVEEASTVSQRSIDLLTPTLRAPSSELWWTWNPRDPKDPVDNLLRCNAPVPDGKIKPMRPPRSWVQEVNYDGNPWFPETLREEMEWLRGRDFEKYLHTWKGHYLRNSEASVFHNWRVASFDTPADATFYHGADWGYAVDPTVLVRSWLGRWEGDPDRGGRAVADPKGRCLFVDAEVWKVGCEIDNTPALFDTLKGSPRQWDIISDSARPETISYMQRHGYPRIKPALKGPSSVMDGIEFLKSYDIYVHPDCTHVADELATYSWKTDPLTGAILPVLEDKKNHTIDSVRYAVEGLRRGGYDILRLV